MNPEADRLAAETLLTSAQTGDCCVYFTEGQWVIRNADALSDLLATHFAEVRREGAREAVKDWKTAWATAREAILHERGPLAEEGAGPDVINAVLGILDDNEPAETELPQPTDTRSENE
jgi:hypothetical protein